MKVPFLDLVYMHDELATKLESKVIDVLRSTQYIGGSEVADFERKFAAYSGAKYCIGVSSGTDALRIILVGLKLDPEAFVITVPNTFIATTEAISQAGLRIKFVDVSWHTAGMDPDKLEACVVAALSKGEKIGAILPVHLYGHPVDMPRILEIGDRYGIPVVEDACQAHGATIGGKSVGAWGKAAAYSFYPGKNLGAFGDAGAIVTDDEELYSIALILREHGQAHKYFHVTEGYTARLDAIQAAYLSVKLEALDQWNNQRRDNAAYLDAALATGSGIKVIQPLQNTLSAYHLYVVLSDKRDELQGYLADQGISTGMHYPFPLHLSPAYEHLGHRKGDFPVAERLCEKVLSLPMYPGMTTSTMNYVVGSIFKFHQQMQVAVAKEA